MREKEVRENQRIHEVEKRQRRDFKKRYETETEKKQRNAREIDEIERCMKINNSCEEIL